MNPQDFLKKPVVDANDSFAVVSVVAGTRTEIVSIRSRTGKIGYLVGLCVNTSGSVDDVTYEVEHNGGPLQEYGKFTVALANPSLWTFLPFPVPIGENCNLKLFATTAVANANVTGRLIIYYTDN